MIEVGENLKTAREISGVTIEEASNDINIPVIFLEQIEEGNIGSFKDIFELKKYISDYAKYLGLNQEEMIDEFNSYLFETTSKIPMADIEKAVREKELEEKNEERIASPYTRAIPKTRTWPYVLSYIGILILVILAVIWSINQIR